MKNKGNKTMTQSYGVTEKRIEEGKSVTLESIETDLNNDCWNALYYATYEQISTLIQQNRISEDFSSRHDNYQEEMRCLKAEFQL